MSAALPSGSPLADAVAMPRVDGASRAVLVGLSGGLDSVVLLHLLCARPEVRNAGLRAIHVHHGLQSAADDWASHCRALCEALDVPLQVVDVDVERDSGLDRKSTRLNSSHSCAARLPPSACKKTTQSELR